MSERRLSHLIKREKVFIYDIRPNIDFKKNSFKTSRNINTFELKGTIKKHALKDRIVLVGPNLRSCASTASWARFEGYRRIFLSPTTIAKITKREMLKKK